MSGRRIARVSLLAFVAASLGYSVFQEFRGGGAADAAATEVSPASGPDGRSAVEGERPASRKLVAYYFHGAKRCNTCRAIEAQSREALETGFPEALLAGHLEWREVNLDDPGNDRFVAEFGVTGSSLVLVEYREGRQARFKTLGKVWDLVADRPAFRGYVQQETREWLEGS
ncbi:hypothetical protein KBD49_09750 [Myxococcota bacterium]|nr:hypothetical protein [Myxococcota bacterium]